MSYRVYFGRLPENLSQDDFEKMLSEHGKARNIEWKSGYAYVDYKHGSDASKTVQNLNGKEVGGNNILVELARNGGGARGGYAVAGAFAARPFAKPPQPRPIRTPHRVRIENLSSRTRWMELKELLSLAGEVTFADTHKRKTGEGIVEFATRQDMEEAIKTFHNTNFYGKTIKIYDESPRGRSRSPSGKKSRSHSRHRSSERKRRSRSKSSSPRKKSSSSRHRSRSPRRSSKRRSRSNDRSRSSRKRDSRSRTPKRNSHQKSKKSKQDSSRSRSKSPKRKKHKHSRSRSHSSSGNNNDLKRKPKKKKRGSSSSSGSDTSDINKSK